MNHEQWKQRHLDAMFPAADHGTVPVVCGGVSGQGLEHRGGYKPFGDTADSESWSVTVPTYLFDTVAVVESSITVNGISAKIIGRNPMDDGATIDLELSEA